MREDGWYWVVQKYTYGTWVVRKFVGGVWKIEHPEYGRMTDGQDSDLEEIDERRITREG